MLYFLLRKARIYLLSDQALTKNCTDNDNNSLILIEQAAQQVQERRGKSTREQRYFSIYTQRKCNGGKRTVVVDVICT